MLGIGGTQPAFRFEEQDKQHKHHQIPENRFELIAADPHGYQGSGNRADAAEHDKRPAFAPIQFAPLPENPGARRTLRENANPVGAVGQVARQTQYFGKNGEGDGRTVAGQGIDDTRHKTADNHDGIFPEVHV